MSSSGRMSNSPGNVPPMTRVSWHHNSASGCSKQNNGWWVMRRLWFSPFDTPPLPLAHLFRSLRKLADATFSVLHGGIMNEAHDPHNRGLSAKDKRMAAIGVLPLGIAVIAIAISSTSSSSTIEWVSGLTLGFFVTFSCLGILLPDKYHVIRKLVTIAGGICAAILIFLLLRELL
jgi:hypothetical protein